MVSSQYTPSQMKLIHHTHWLNIAFTAAISSVYPTTWRVQLICDFSNNYNTNIKPFFNGMLEAEPASLFASVFSFCCAHPSWFSVYCLLVFLFICPFVSILLFLLKSQTQQPNERKNRCSLCEKATTSFMIGQIIWSNRMTIWSQKVHRRDCRIQVMC